MNMYLNTLSTLITDGSSGQPSYLPLLLGSAFFLGLVSILIMLKLWTTKTARKRSLRRHLQYLDSILDQAQSRVSLIDEPALAYLNVMDSQGNRAFEQLRRLLVATKQRIEDIRTLLITEDLESIVEAEELVDQPLSLKVDSLNAVYTDKELPPVIITDLENVLDELFEIVGSEISRASEEAHRLGWKKKRNRRRTIDLLLAAGIRAVMRHGRRMSHSFSREEILGLDEDDNETPEDSKHE
ncbi:MAG: hypothetical protein PHC51_00250 [bacterium]|nr:hypothetical protein [bacterium]